MKNFWENIFRKDKEARNVCRILKGCPVFSELSNSELKFLESIVHIRSYKSGEVIFKQNEVGVGMYVIMDGFVDISVENLDSSGDQGPRLITRLEPDDFFGEIALVEENGRRTATATASNDVTLIGFFQPDLEEVVDRSPLTGSKILKSVAQVIGRRLRATSDKVIQLKNEMHQDHRDL